VIRPRRRRTKETARREILAAAHERLVEGGPPAVRVQLVANDVGVTDAAVHHHFGNRDGLVRELLRSAARDLARQVADVVEAWQPGGLDLEAMIRTLTRAYHDAGLSRVIAWLVLDGWKPRGRGMFRPIADALRGAGARRDPPPDAQVDAGEQALFITLLMNQVAWTEAFAGDLFRRATGFPDDPELPARYRRWVAHVLHHRLVGGTRAP
jgi:AcrR family transcriptional regulator